MTDSLTLIDMFVRGVAVGAMGVTGMALLASGLSRQIRLTGGLLSLSIACWLITESHTLWPALGHAYPLVLPAHAVAALFWLFVLTVFDDRRLSAGSWAPAALLLAAGIVCDLLPLDAREPIWAARNIFGGLLLLHAAYVIVRGWSGDLLEQRRRLRAPVLGFATFYGLSNVVIALVNRAAHSQRWLEWTAGWPYGAAVFAIIVIAASAVFLQVRPAVFGGGRRETAGADARAEAADRMLTGRLNDLMAAGAWRRERLTIGALAAELGEPEHRLRRLINQRLGHRNFADFVNGYRIEAAKQRLADPREVRTTVAAIAFDLGYGSLGPFNRAFRAATGATPTEWRRDALQSSPDLQEAV
ncbi:MAG: helix-turn-helix domain-containing protein [Pseudomonadota bacterium]